MAKKKPVIPKPKFRKCDYCPKQSVMMRRVKKGKKLIPEHYCGKCWISRVESKWEKPKSTAKKKVVVRRKK